ncbi:ABC transporter permease [Puia sp.]|jgi:predicted permease|uniref:ABC transporter permease n=1 Tax=Puia sp. TaxID=2045100 RepID=UPI002F3F6EEB
MLKNYLRVALRSLARNRLITAINIGGLAIGMAVAILIGLWIADELSFDHGPVRHEKIAAVLQNQTISGGRETWWGEAMQLAPVLRKEYGRFFKYVVLDGGASKRLMAFGEKKMSLLGNCFEPPVIDLLSLKMISGNNTALDDANSVILSVPAAKSLFGDADPMGKTILADNKYPLRVTGVFAKMPANSSWANTDYICPFALKVQQENLDTRVNWGNSWFRVYVQLNDHVSMEQASRAIKYVKRDNAPNDRRFNPELFLHPMDRWHLYSDFKDGVSAGGRITYVRLYSIIAVFVLILACINFMNLSTARSEKRAKEVGIRKAIGSLRGQLIGQFYSESLVIAFFAFVFAIGIAQLLLPFFNETAQKKMHVPYASPGFWLAGLAFTGFTAVLAGSYPALYLSSFQPVKVLKGTFKVGKLAALPRKALVVVQFTVSVILIVGTLVILRQIQFVKDRPVGYDRSGLLFIPRQNLDLTKYSASITASLMETGFIESVAGSQSEITNTWVTNSGFSWKGKDPAMMEEFVTNGVTPEFGKTNRWQIVGGRDFRPNFATDSNNIILNETAVKYMGLARPLGEVVKWGNNGLYTVIGVVKDMVSQSPYQPVAPMIFYLSDFLSFSRINSLDIRVRPQASMSRALAAIQAVLKKYDPEDPFEYVFADQDYARKFGDEERVSQLAGAFTLLAIFISCLGLLGLSAFVAEQRTREVGIRKVLGASVLNLWNLLSREFVWLVSISLLIGAPIAYAIMHSWLSTYAYRADLSWWIFAVTAAGAIGLTLFTVSFQAIKAALSNPVKALHSE